VAIVNGYCTAQELRDQLQDGNSNLSTALLERAINAASRAVDKHCGRRFWKDAAVVARTYQPALCREVIVDDIADRTGLIVATDEALDGTFSTVWPSSDYELGPRNADVVASGSSGDAFAFWKIAAINEPGNVFPVSAHRATVRVTAKFGWSAVPADVNEATILKAASLFKRKDAPFGIAGVNDFGPVRITRTDPDVIELLRAFRRFYNRSEA
jgi:hypothetical protein